MADKIKQLLDKSKKYWLGLESKKRKKIILFLILFLISISIIGTVLSVTEYTVLYSELDVIETGQILSVLKELGIKTKSSENGTVLVDKTYEDTARMELAMQGYPKSGLNYDLYLNSINFTTSSQDKNVMLIYQLQDRLSKVISKLEGINDAVVTISMENDDVFKFKDEISPVSACVVLEFENNFNLDKEQIRAIQRLMVTSISGLKEENVAIIDSNLNNLNFINDNDPYSQPINNHLLLEQKIENQITDKVMYLFEPVFGTENIKVRVNAIVDFDKKVTEIIKYSPVIDDEGIPYIIDELKDKVSDSTQNNGQTNSNYAVESDSLNDRMQKVINYRVNELRQTIDEAQGVIEDISVSILINDIDIENSALEDVKEIAAAAVGIDTSKINVSYMEFTANKELKAKIQDSLNNNKEKEFPFSYKAIIGLVGIIFAFIFALIILRLLKDTKSKETQTVTNVFEKQMEEMSIYKDEDHKENIRILNKEREIIKEIENNVKNNPKAMAQLLSMWIKDDK